MDRRAVMVWLAATATGGCGGGAGGAAPTGESDAIVPAAPTAPGNASIAMWGDSLTPPVAANLQLLYPAREIYNGGVAGQPSSAIAQRQMSDTAGRRSWINVIWYGQNNPTQAAQILADIAASVAALAPGNDRFVVMSVVNKARPEEVKGGEVYATIMQMNGALAARYAGRYLDIRSFLVSQFDPGRPQDVADFQSDVVPSSLRFDEIHLNNEGSVLVARRLKQFIDAQGW